MSTQAPERHEFQAEVKQVLDIVVHSLYTDKDIFVRELVSNASDALEKLRHTQMTEPAVYDDKLSLEINITTDDTAGTLTIQDFGIGMTRAELVENLGTIAHSGSKAFVKALQAKGTQAGENLIGQFGVGFYSAFMVAKEVRVYTHGWRPDAESLLWTSDGSGTYTIEPVDTQRRGCKIVVSLKDEYKDFSKADRVRQILERYSSFIQFPVNLNGERVNTVQALWLKAKNEITEDQYKEFYKFQARAFDEPLAWLHFSADAPLAINALLFIPGENPERWGFGKVDASVSLFCRKVLIDDEPKGLLPDWLRFLKGVVDSADLPLNISRETMQDSALVQKLNRVLTKRLIKFLEDLAAKEPEKFATFWAKFGAFIKEGVTTDFTHREALAPLLRFESSTLEKGKLTGLADYVSRMKSDQKDIYYLIGPNREAVESGPYLEAFKARGLEVLFLYEPIDDFVMNHLRDFDKKPLVPADREDLDLGENPAHAQGEPLAADTLKGLCDWLSETLGKDRVTSVTSGDKRLVDSPCVVLNTDKFMTAHMRRVMRAMKPELAPGDEAASVALQVNPRHALIKNLASLKDRDADLAKLVAEQLYDNALVSAGLLDNPRPMALRTFRLLEILTSK